MSDLIVSISGIRGIPGRTLFPETVVCHVRAFAAFCGTGCVVVGNDGRPSGRAITDIVTGTLRMAGLRAVDLGMVPTPTVQLAVEEHAAAGGIAITASHNPSEWNGLKFLDRTGIFLDASQNARLRELAQSAQHPYKPWDALGTIDIDTGMASRHVRRVLASPVLDVAAVRARAFTVVVDAVNASGSSIVPELLRALGCTVHPLHCDGSGIFPHMPEPLPVNLQGLGDAVRSHRADLGIAVDPDADRLVLFDNAGQPFGEEYTVTIAADTVLSRLPRSAGRSVVVNLSTTRAVEDVARRHDARLIRTPVGEINVVRAMLESGADIGGEGSGGVIMPAVHAGRDSLVGIALVLQALASHDGDSRSLRHSYPEYSIRKSRYPLDGIDASGALTRAAQLFANERVNTDDGVRIDFADGWVHLRTSNTEPILRVIAEAGSPAEADALAARVTAAVFS